MQNGTKHSQGSSLMKFKFTLQQTAVSVIGGKVDRIDLKSCTTSIYFSFREYIRATSKRPDANRISTTRDQYAQASTQVHASVISNEINPPEVFLNRDVINQSKLRRNKKQQTNKDRQNKQLKLTGNVDLGSNVFKQGKQSRRKNVTRKQARTTTQHPNTISEDFHPNHHRHNHYDSRQEQQKINRRPTTASTPYPSTYLAETSTPRAYFTQSTTTPVSTVTTTQTATRVLEKVIKLYDDSCPLNLRCENILFLQKQRLEKVRQKLLNLTEEEKLEYLKLKAERKAQKSKSINDTIP